MLIIIFSRMINFFCELDFHVAWQATQHGHGASYHVDGRDTDIYNQSRSGLLLHGNESEDTMEEGEHIYHTFFSFHRARRPTPDTFTTLKRTPGISPLALPLRPKPEMRTSSFSSTKFKQPSFFPNVSIAVTDKTCHIQGRKQ